MPEMPAGRKKLIHSIGSVCEFELKIGSSPFTGLLGRGTQKGFIRMGSAADITGNDGVTPGIGIKMVRDGIHSGDVVFLHSLDLGQSYDFFAYNMSNHIPPATGATAVLAKKFEQASQCSPQVGISDMARYSRNGAEHNPPRFPFKLLFVPKVSTSASKKDVDELHREMAAFPVGTTLYTAYGCRAPKGDEMLPTDGTVSQVCGDPVLLGDIKTTSKCLTSKYGDESFHIRHQRIEEDWALRPDYVRSGGYNAGPACGRNFQVTSDGAPAVCGSAGMRADEP